jgi:DNA gyrase subunit A
MDILPSQVVAIIDSVADVEDEDDSEELIEEAAIQTPWLLTITNKGYGKRVPVSKFRLQNRAGMGVRAIKFKSKEDRLAAIHVVNPEEELMIVTNRGIIIRQSVDAISLQSRSATGVRVQKLDKDDAITAVALVPLPTEEEGCDEEGCHEEE